MVDDIYLMASFNNWLPVKMEAWEKKQVQLTNQKDVIELGNQIRESIKGLQIPSAILEDHVKTKHGELFKYIDSIEPVVVEEEEAGEEEDENVNEDKVIQVPESLIVFKSLVNKEEEKGYNPDNIKSDIAYNYAKFLPSGRHFFYFIRQGRFFSLSDLYPVKRYKKTNLYMNEIQITAKSWKVSDFNFGEVVGIKQRKKFDQGQSIFRTFKLETEDTLKKMFALDFKYTKIKKIYKGDPAQVEKVKEILWKNFDKIKNIFLTGILTSEYPVITWNDFTLLSNKCKIPDKACNVATVDRIFIASNINQNIPGAQGDKDLVRYEFLEIIVRLANAKFTEPKICATSVEAI